MRVSKLFTKTSKFVAVKDKARSHELLTQAGYINQEMAGAYSLLPLGINVLRKIENIIREEMNAIDSQEILMPAIHPQSNWEKTGRWESVDILFKVPSRWGKTTYALAPTHEEIVFPLVKRFLFSYKDLPISVYQIQNKFRDEKRAKSGIIRGREFGMKDMYSFHETEEELREYYEKAKEAYLKVFRRCGIDAKVTKASGGDFTKKYSHEFMAISDAGEDVIIACSSCVYAENTEVSELKEKSSCPECGEKMEMEKAIEIGNIFDLGIKFSKDFDIEYTDKDGKKKVPVAGCYGIGTTRLIGSAVEVNNDEKGIIWPEEISPFDVHLVGLNLDKKEVKDFTNDVYKKLRDAKISVFYDDREDVSGGFKLKDADLIGISKQIIVSEKLFEKNMVEYKERRSGETETDSLENIIDKIL
jgi:prolyl-tRNA synthetase